MGQGQLNADLSRGRCDNRPVRVAFLIQEDEHAHLALDGIFADCYRRWGGRFSLIVPCEQSTIPNSYWPWLKAYDPDIVYSYFHMADQTVLELHERVGPSVYEEHRNRERLDVHGFAPRYGAQPLQSLSTIFRRSRHRDHRSTDGPLPIIDSWQTEVASRFLTDNFGTYGSSYATSIYPVDARASAQLLTIVSPEKQTDRRHVPPDLLTTGSELEAFKEFAHRRASSLSIASMDFATKLNVHHGQWSDSFNLVVGGSYLDRILFWNGRLLLPNWIGSDIGAFRIEVEQLGNDEFVVALAALINQRNFVNSGTGGQYHVTIRSSSVVEEELSAVGERLRAAKCWSMSRTQFVPDLVAMVPSPKDLEQASPSSPLGSIFDLQGRLNEFNWTPPIANPISPPPDHLADAPHRQTFTTGVWASDYLLSHNEDKPRFSNENAWLLPRRWRMAGAFKAEFTSTSRELAYPPRSTRAGELTLFESVARRARTITVPSGKDAIRYALAEDGQWQRLPAYHGPRLPKNSVDWMEPSNEARYLSGIVGMSGSLDEASRFLLHPFMQGMFAALGGTPGLPIEKVQPTVARLRKASQTTTSFDLKDENERLALGKLIVKAAQNQKTPLHYLRYQSLAERWQQHLTAFWDRLGRPAGADESVDWDGLEQPYLDDCLIAMRQRQMVFQGHEWLCPECHHRNWVDMAELRTVLSCTICRHETDAPITFDWLFRPSSFVIEALRDHSTLSLLWALNSLGNEGRNAFIYAGPTWFWYDNRDRGADAEADLLIVADQTTIVAEVKSSWASVRSVDIAALGAVAKRLRPDVALLAVMDTGRKHEAKLDQLTTELGELEIKLRVMTLDTNPVEDEPYL